VKSRFSVLTKPNPNPNPNPRRGARLPQQDPCIRFLHCLLIFVGGAPSRRRVWSWLPFRIENDFYSRQACGCSLLPALPDKKCG